jgi:putative addiction module component (TIGR02574 family)
MSGSCGGEYDAEGYNRAMATAPTIESLQQAALRLEPDARVQLAHTLVESLGELPEAELAELWLREAERRDQEMDAGRVKGIPGQEVFARIQAHHGK